MSQTETIFLGELMISAGRPLSGQTPPFGTFPASTHHHLHQTGCEVYYLIGTAACRRACMSGLFLVCWADRCTMPGAHPSRSCSGRVFWHRAHLGPSRGPVPSPGGSTTFQCSSSVHCPLGRGTGPGPGCWHHRYVHGRFGSLRGWMWSAPSLGYPGNRGRYAVGSL